VIVDHDLHVHTIFSDCCCDADSIPEHILPRAAEAGLRTIGFADHMWDSSVPGASAWYRPQNFDHIRRVRRLMPPDTAGVRVLFGCETEYCGDGKVGISPEVAEELDFVLIPVSHFHMSGFVRPRAIDQPADVAALLVARFNEVMGLGLATGIAHPFLPLGFKQATDEIVALIPDGQLTDCFGRAAERRVSIEITTSFFPGLNGGEPPGFHDETFLRLLTLARGAGCLFHFASDTHTLEGVGTVRKLEPYAQALGITPDHVLPLARPH